MPIKGTVVGQKREGNKLVLYYKDSKTGRIKREVRTKCKCSKDKNKPCKC